MKREKGKRRKKETRKLRKDDRKPETNTEKENDTKKM